jgi:hypothetical protein
LQSLAKDKHSSFQALAHLIQKSVNYGRKKFYSTGANVINLFTAVIYESS